MWKGQSPFLGPACPDEGVSHCCAGALGTARAVVSQHSRGERAAKLSKHQVATADEPGLSLRVLKQPDLASCLQNVKRVRRRSGRGTNPLIYFHFPNGSRAEQEEKSKHG